MCPVDIGPIKNAMDWNNSMKDMLSDMLPLCSVVRENTIGWMVPDVNPTQMKAITTQTGC